MGRSEAKLDLNKVKNFTVIVEEISFDYKQRQSYSMKELQVYNQENLFQF